MIAGFGRFIPYLGAFIGWVGFAIGALIQNPTPFGLTPFVYMLLVLGVSLFIDVILDHLVTPSVMSEALDVHPAAILISALVGGQMFRDLKIECFVVNDETECGSVDEGMLMFRFIFE